MFFFKVYYTKETILKIILTFDTVQATLTIFDLSIRGFSYSKT